MYTEENARGRFPLRDILLKAIVVIIFLILIIFIVTKVTEPNNNTAKSSSNYDKVFSENLEAMENAAYSYFTTDRLPKETGEVSELTLREMINSNLLNAFTDDDGKACNVNNSFIRYYAFGFTANIYKFAFASDCVSCPCLDNIFNILIVIATDRANKCTKA